ncbi:MAG TPA: YceI family protein [Bacteroidia bacterium]
MKKIFITLAAFTIYFSADAQNSYTSDKNHTKVGFSVTHFGISHVEGRFKNVAATLVAKKEDFTDAVVEITIDVKSIDTDIEMRDKDLKGGNWFDVDKYPTLIFKSTLFKKVNNKNYILEGTITIHGITKPILLEVVYNGKALNPMTKKSSVGFTITGKLYRNDFLVGTGVGNSLVSNEIELISNAEFIID